MDGLKKIAALLVALIGFVFAAKRLIAAFAAL